MCDRKELDVADIPPEVHQVRQLSAGTRAPRDLVGVSLNELEKQAIMDTLAKTGNNRERAAKILAFFSFPLAPAKEVIQSSHTTGPDPAIINNP